ncbi:MAG: hypothetical protein MK165_03005 [Pirellulaceae bacterium]|nr:hypothetical protein [Pirellulaceae bacterium]
MRKKVGRIKVRERSAKLSSLWSFRECWMSAGNHAGKTVEHHGNVIQARREF